MGKLLFNLLPSFSINKHEGAEGRGSASYIESIVVKLVRRRRKKKKKQGRGASVIDSYIVLRSLTG